MYVRRPHPLSPPANYAGVAFSMDQPKADTMEQPTKIHKASEQHAQIHEEKSPALLPARDETTVLNDIEDKDEKNSNNEEIKCDAILSKLSDGKFSLEDILLFASLFLLASGQTEDELLLLAGVILLLCNS